MALFNAVWITKYFFEQLGLLKTRRALKRTRRCCVRAFSVTLMAWPIKTAWARSKSCCGSVEVAIQEQLWLVLNTAIRTIAMVIIEIRCIASYFRIGFSRWFLTIYERRLECAFIGIHSPVQPQISSWWMRFVNDADQAFLLQYSYKELCSLYKTDSRIIFKENCTRNPLAILIIDVIIGTFPPRICRCQTSQRMYAAL